MSLSFLLFNLEIYYKAFSKTYIAIIIITVVTFIFLNLPWQIPPLSNVLSPNMIVMTTCSKYFY